jgi:hypothetical protein
MRLHQLRLTALVLLFLLASALPLSIPAANAQPASRLFPETGKTVRGLFLDYWNRHGGLAQQGYPISEETQEKSDTDGKIYTVQYFERAVFEYHPENASTSEGSIQSNVLLSLLGVFRYNQKYPAGAPGQQPNNSAGSILFPETGKRIGRSFLAYWQKNGGLAQQGYPISDEFTEKSDLQDEGREGKSYRVQYFERAVFEAHPENRPLYDVLLSQLGTFRYRAKYSQAPPPPNPVIIPTPMAGCTSNLDRGLWQGPFDWQFSLTSDSGLTGDGALKANLSLDVACDGTLIGTATTVSYNARGLFLGRPVLTCDATTEPVGDFTGRVVAMPDGLHLLIAGGKWREGVIACSNPATASAPQTQDLAGQPIDPADVRVETVSEGKITGSQWLANPALAAIQEKVHTILPNAKTEITTTGHWELIYHPTNPR